MKGLSGCTPFWWIVYFTCSSVETQSNSLEFLFADNNADPNNITVTCAPGTAISSDCKLVFSMNGRNSSVPVKNKKYNFSVTPQNESRITCICTIDGKDVTSPTPLKIAAIQYASNMSTINEFRNESSTVTLTCPLVLGNLQKELEPYFIMWMKETVNGSYTTNFTRKDISADNRRLTITKSGLTPTTFECSLKLKRCDQNKCDSDDYGKTKFLLNLIAPISVQQSTKEQSIDIIGMAIFHCNATGTNISLSWDCSGSVNCSEFGMIMDTNVIEDDITIVSSSLKVVGHKYPGPVTINITCTVRQQLVNVPEGGEPDRNETVTFTLEVRNGTVMPTNTDAGLMTTRTLQIAVSVFIFFVLLLIVVVVVIVVVCCCARKHRKSNASFSVESTTGPPLSLVSRKKTPIYEELPCTVYHADHPLLLRQYGVESDPNLSKIENISCHSEEPLCSDVSGLSGVSGNVPGAHKMPMYSTDGSMFDNLLPPQPWTRSHSTFNSAHTQSTILGSNSNYEHQSNPHSYTHSELCISGSPDPIIGRRRCASNGAIRSNSEQPYPEEVLYPVHAGSHSYPDHPPPFSNSPLRSDRSVSRASSNSSVQKQSLSYTSPSHSSITEHPSSLKFISNDELISVVNSLKHNRNCAIPGCLCQQFRDRYYEIEALALSSNKQKPYERQVTNSNTIITSSSTESDSDTPDNNGRRARMRLELGKGSNPQMYPHYHLSSKSYIRKTAKSEVVRQSRRRSRSVSDLTPITEIREIATPKIGGPIVPGTPICQPKTLGIGGNSSVAYEAPTKQELLSSHPMSLLEKPMPPLLRQKSMSMDNIPVLCLNDCLAKLVTPSPSKSYSLRLTTIVNNNNPAEPVLNTAEPVLNTVHETSNSLESDDSNTSSRSESPPEPEAVKSSPSSSQSDSEEATEASLPSCRNSVQTRTSMRRVGPSSGYESMEGENGSTVSVLTDASSKRRNSDLKSYAWSRMSPVPVSRSSSPFETETKVSSDGCTTMTTEC